MKKLLCMVLAMVMLATVIAGCASSQNGDKAENDKEGKDLPVLRVAIMPLMLSAPVYYIMEQGLDVKSGFKIEPVLFTLGPPMNEALAANLWDVGTMGAAAVTGITTYDAKIIADISNSAPGVEVFARPDHPATKIKGFNPTYPELLGNPETVKGKTILVTTGTGHHMNVLKWLEHIGVKAEDTNIVHGDTSMSYQAFLSGEADFVSLIPPFTYSARDNGWVKVASIEDNKFPHYDTLIVNPRSFDSKKELLVKFVKVLFEANETLEKDLNLKTETLKSWYAINGSTIDDKIVEIEAKTRPYLSAQDNLSKPVGDWLKMIAEFRVSIGTLDADKLPMFDTNLTDEILKEALK